MRDRVENYVSRIMVRIAYFIKKIIVGARNSTSTCWGLLASLGDGSFASPVEGSSLQTGEGTGERMVCCWLLFWDDKNLYFTDNIICPPKIKN